MIDVTPQQVPSAQSQPVLSASASRVAPTPLLPAPDELLEELELLLEEELEVEEELELEEDELELEELDVLEELELLDEEELDEFELDTVPPQAVRVPIVKHTRPAFLPAT